MYEVQMKNGMNLYGLLVDVGKEGGENEYCWEEEFAP